MKHLSLAGLCLVFGCATLAAEGRGDVDLPNTLTGPFRALKRAKTCDGDVCTGINELPAGVPNGVVDYPANPPSRSPSVLPLGGLRVAMYAARGTPSDRIARMVSADGRTFVEPLDVITIDAAFEGKSIGDPCALFVGQSVWLYYATDQGIALARSTDGITFTKEPRLVVVDGTPATWESGVPRAPGVIRLDDGAFHLFYASGKSIGEAVSRDGVTFTRVGLALAPSAPVDPATLPEGVRPPFDDDAVDDPWIDHTATEGGRVQFRLHYTGRDRRGGSSIGFAGRFGTTGTFEKRDGFVFGGKLFGDPDGNSHANAPSIARFGDFALIYANFDVDKAQKIGIGIAPQRRLLPID